MGGKAGRKKGFRGSSCRGRGAAGPPPEGVRETRGYSLRRGIRRVPAAVRGAMGDRPRPAPIQYS